MSEGCPRGEGLTYREAARWAAERLGRAGVESPRTDARLLLAEATGEGAEVLWLHPERELGGRECERFFQLVERRRQREPLAYIRGRAEFFGRPFYVSPAVLIPRPETELLVEAALERIPPDGEGILVDVGTGSGCIAVTLCLERPGIEVLAVDLSAGALAVARRNGELHGVAKRIHLMQGNLLEPLNPAEYREGLLAVLANPPYVAEAEWEGLEPEVRRFEPRSALVAPDEGYGVSENLVRMAPPFLAPGGFLALEVGAGQASRLAALCRDAGLETEIRQDYAGHERVVLAEKRRRSEEETG